MSCSDSSIVNAGNLRRYKPGQPGDKVTSTPAVHNLQRHPEVATDESSVDDDNVFPAVPTSASITAGSSSCKTPARNFGFGNTSDISMMKTPGSGRGSSERIRRMRHMIRTPSGPRMNPFEAHISTDLLQGPTFSPSVFSTVVSPSQEKGSFWTLDQQAHLFPAQISDDSPWKQEAVSRLDPDMENRTQEAIDLYFSRHSHQITSPEDLQPTSRSMMSFNNRSSHLASVGGSPNLTTSAAAAAAATTPTPMEASTADVKNVSGKNPVDLMDSSSNGSCPPAKRWCSQWTQTVCSLPPILPDEVEKVLAGFFTFNEDQSNQLIAAQQVVGGNEDGNNSTLRRKLFAGIDDDDDDDDDGKVVVKDRHDSSAGDISSDDDDLKENEISNIIMPGTVMMTPTAARPEKSPNKSLSWSLSPVSRKKSIKGPLGSSTPTK